MRMARRLHEEIARILLREVEDPLIRLVTITDGAISPDLKHARVFFSVVGEDAEATDALHGLRRASKFIRHRLADEAELRFTPELEFRHDPTAAKAQRIEAILHRLADEGGLQPEEPAEGEAPAPDDDDDE